MVPFVSPSHWPLKFKFHCHISVSRSISSQSSHMCSRVQTSSSPLILVSFIRSNDIIFWVHNDSSIAICRTVWLKLFNISVVLVRSIHHILLGCVMFCGPVRDQVRINVFATCDINRLCLILFKVPIYTMQSRSSLLLKLSLFSFEFAQVFFTHGFHVVHFNLLVFGNPHHFNIRRVLLPWVIRFPTSHFRRQLPS